MFPVCFLLMFLYIAVFSVHAYADQDYHADRMSGLYAGAWVRTAYDFTYYEPVSGFADLKGSEDAVISDAIYYRYNKAMDLFVLIYRGFQDYEPTLEGIRNYVTGLGCTGIRNANCNGLGVIQFENQTDHYRELNIAFPDREGAIIQVTVQCSDDELMYAFGREVFSSVIPNADADAYLNSVREDAVGHIYHLSDFGPVYNGTWITLLDFFRLCAPDEAGWENLTGTETALSCDAIAMYRNDSLGIMIIIYYGFQPYNTTEGIFNALTVKPEYLNLHYSRCNGLMVVDFEKENRDHSIAFADSAGGIVQVTVQCSDPRLRNLYSEQLFSSLIPTDIATSNGVEIPPEYKEYLNQKTVTEGDETLSMEGSRFAIWDVNEDGIQELLVRYPMESSRDGLSDIYIYILIDGRVHLAGKLASEGTTHFPGYSSKGYYYDASHDYRHNYFSWDVYEISGTALSLVVTFRIEINMQDASLSAYYIDKRKVSSDEFNSTFSVYLDGTMVWGEDGLADWNGYKWITFSENIYLEIYITIPEVPVPQDTPAPAPLSLTEEEKKMFADFLTDDIWQSFNGSYEPDAQVFPQFCLIDVTGDGHEELAVQGNSESMEWSIIFYSIIYDEDYGSDDVVPIGGYYVFDSYTELGYSSFAHLPYRFWNDYGNRCMEITVLEYDGTGLENYDEMFDYGYTQITFSLIDGTYSIDEEEVSEEEFSAAFREILGDPLPYEAETETFSHYLWDGFESVPLIDNTPENRLAVLGYEGSYREYY